MPKRILIAGATGYLGRYLVDAFAAAGWQVHALVRDAAKAKSQGLKAHQLRQAQATDPTTLPDVMKDIDVVISALGITRQRDGLTYQDVDFQANANLLQAAEDAGVSHFSYVHVLNGETLTHCNLIKAKQDFVDRLHAAPIASTVIAPGGYFSDMGDFLEMANSGRVYLIGQGELTMNPIHGADLAAFAVTAVENGTPYITAGGPDTLTQNQIAELAFRALGKPVKITHLPPVAGRMAVSFLRRFTKEPTFGPIEFFIAAMSIGMVGESTGTHHLADHFVALAAQRKLT